MQTSNLGLYTNTEPSPTYRLTFSEEVTVRLAFCFHKFGREKLLGRSSLVYPCIPVDSLLIDSLFPPLALLPWVEHKCYQITAADFKQEDIDKITDKLQTIRLSSPPRGFAASNWEWRKNMILDIEKNIDKAEGVHIIPIFLLTNPCSINIVLLHIEYINLYPTALNELDENARNELILGMITVLQLAAIWDHRNYGWFAEVQPEYDISKKIRKRWKSFGAIPADSGLNRRTVPIPAPALKRQAKKALFSSVDTASNDAKENTPRLEKEASSSALASSSSLAESAIFKMPPAPSFSKTQVEILKAPRLAPFPSPHLSLPETIELDHYEEEEAEESFEDLNFVDDIISFIDSYGEANTEESDDFELMHMSFTDDESEGGVPLPLAMRELC